MNEKYSKTICIVTPGYITSSPRTVKEADALRKAGFNVRVVFSQGNLEWLTERDQVLLKTKPWRYNVVRWSPSRREERLVYYKSKIRFHALRVLPPGLWRFGRLAEHAEGRIYGELAVLAAREKADLYIGHYPTGLAAAAYAASRWNAKLGYDMEDLHIGENVPESQRKRIELIERRYLTYCSYLTAVSDPAAHEVAKHYSVKRPVVIHNVFPWDEREKIDKKIKERKGARLSLYWYSQVIGEDRGIQDAIMAAGLIKEKIELHLRGNIYGETKKRFLDLARQHGIGDKVHFHPPAPPTELLSRAAEHDVGLALEQPVSLSRKLSVTNKFFLYLLAGLAVCATDTPGQRSIMSTCSDAGFLYRPGDYRSLADKLDRLISEPERLETCKEAALKAARDKWNWEMESAKLVHATERLLSSTK